METTTENPNRAVAVATRSPGEVEAQHEKLTNTISRIENGVARLEDALDRVVLPGNPEAAEEKIGTDPPPRSTLAMDLHTDGNRLVAIELRLDRLRDRIDL
jgi:hypothetical protein